VRNRSTVVKTSSSAAAPRRAGAPAGAPGASTASVIDERVEADERFGVMFALWLVGRATVEAIDHRIGATGLSADEFPIYCILDIAAPVTPTALGSWMAAAPTTVSAVVKRLEARGHVTRSPNGADGRSHLLRLTDAGRVAQMEAIALFAPLAGRVEGELGSSTPQLRADLLRLRRILDAIGEGADDQDADGQDADG
jgi:DNA-binding MarR family transcriptional regulator